MFNFFGEIKKELKITEFIENYNLVNIGGKIVYVEGVKSLVSLANELVMFKVKGKIISVYGTNLKLKVLSSSTLTITGDVQKIEEN